jgi:hypothetical protein
MAVCFLCNEPATLECPDCGLWFCKVHITNNVPGQPPYKYFCVICAARRTEEKLAADETAAQKALAAEALRREQAEQQKLRQQQLEQYQELERQQKAAELERRTEEKAQIFCKECKKNANETTIYTCRKCGNKYCLTCAKQRKKIYTTSYGSGDRNNDEWREYNVWYCPGWFCGVELTNDKPRY